MRVVLVNYAHFAEDLTPGAVIDAFPTLEGWAQGLREAGAEVAVVVGFGEDAFLRRQQVDYHFVAGRFAPQMSTWRLPRRLHRVVLGLRPEVVHLNGLIYGLQARSLRRRLPPSSVLVAQHHAARPAAGWRRLLQRWALQSVDGFQFTGRASAEPWLRAGVIAADKPIIEIVESSSRFQIADRAVSRAESGLVGDPVFLWLGNLNDNKDPLTVLDVLDEVLIEHRSARLYMAFRDDELMAEVVRRIASSRRLSGAVELLGRVPPAKVELLLNSADFFLQGSRREAAGFALIEALACGVVPIVTDIPSFRFLTREGELGELWPVGDRRGLKEAIHRALSLRLEVERPRLRDHFDSCLSFAAIGRQALDAYGKLAQRSRA